MKNSSHMRTVTLLRATCPSCIIHCEEVPINEQHLHRAYVGIPEDRKWVRLSLTQHRHGGVRRDREYSYFSCRWHFRCCASYWLWIHKHSNAMRRIEVSDTSIDVLHLSDRDIFPPRGR